MLCFVGVLLFLFPLCVSALCVLFFLFVYVCSSGLVCFVVYLCVLQRVWDARHIMSCYNYVLQRVWGARDIMSCRGAGAQDSLCLAQGLGKAGPNLVNFRVFGASAGEALNSLFFH